MLKVGAPVSLALFRVTANILYTQIFHIDLSVDVFSPSYIFSLCELNFTICIFCPNQPYHVQIPVHFLKVKTINLFWTEPILVWLHLILRELQSPIMMRKKKMNQLMQQLIHTDCWMSTWASNWWFFIGSNRLFFCLSGHIFSWFMCFTLYGYV